MPVSIFPIVCPYFSIRTTSYRAPTIPDTMYITIILLIVLKLFCIALCIVVNAIRKIAPSIELASKRRQKPAYTRGRLFASVFGGFSKIRISFWLEKILTSLWYHLSAFLNPDSFLVVFRNYRNGFFHAFFFQQEPEYAIASTAIISLKSFVALENAWMPFVRRSLIISSTSNEYFEV